MSPHPLTNLEIQRYYQNEPRFNGVYSRDNLPDKIKDGAYVINIEEYADTGPHWIALHSMKLHSNGNAITYLDSFGNEHLPKQTKSSSTELHSKNLRSQQIFLE